MKTKFLIADAVAPEAAGKLTLMGFFPDDTIVIDVPKPPPGKTLPPPGLDNLACLLTLSGLPDGKHRLRGELYDPAGQLNSQAPEIDFTIEDGNASYIPLRLQPFVISAGAGEYTWKFKVGEREFTHSFYVRLAKPKA